MKGKSHKLVTRKAFKILRETGDATSQFLDRGDVVEDYALKTDKCRDLELVDVDYCIDDPHKDEWHVADDDPHHERDLVLMKMNFTAFNHYIDIKKGDGTFDDYDGYSYNRGSASKDEYQDIGDLMGDLARRKLGLPNAPSAWKARITVDKFINRDLKDEYVHAPGHNWYIKGKCSPSLEKYSFPEGKGKYESVEEECTTRFPMVNTDRSKGGVPWSIFIPVDNMARYCYSEFLKTDELTYGSACLGSVMHAIQDASVPHHAAGYSGNWHAEYEMDLQSNIPKWLGDVGFTNAVKRVFAEWNQNEDQSPSHLNVGDWRRKPSKNWEIDQLVTWVALNAYREYDETYNHFRDGYKFDEYSAINLVKIATAMSLLVLKNAADHLKSRS